MNTVLKLAFKPADWLLQWPDKNNMFLQGPYAPVSEEISNECEVVGELPEAVCGEFVRVGPNPRFAPTGGYHWFDGDGMVHGVRIKGGKATYTNRYVRTKMLAAAEEAGEPVNLKLGDMASGLAIPAMLMYNLKTRLGLAQDWTGMNESTANTALEFHAGRLMALSEAGMPYALRVMCDGMLETIGKVSFDGALKRNFTAHPKKDPSSGKLYAFGYKLDQKPFLSFYVLDRNGKFERQIPIDLPRGVMMHDFAITENYAVFLDLPMVVQPQNFLKGKMPIGFDDTQGARMGVLPLNATDSSNIRWFDMPDTFIAFHVLNAWEETVEVEGQDGAEPTTNTVVKVVTCDMFAFSLDLDVLMADASPASMPQPHTTVLNLDTGTASRTSLLPLPPTEGLDFPQIRRTLVGRKTRFGYFTSFDPAGFPTGVVKLDLQAANPDEAMVGRIDFGDGLGGECVFIPSTPDVSGEEEDDGFLATFVSFRDGGNSELRVWDAKTMSAKPVATIKLPARVPLGFHALFVSEADLATQLKE